MVWTVEVKEAQEAVGEEPERRMMVAWRGRGGSGSGRPVEVRTVGNLIAAGTYMCMLPSMEPA